MTKPLQTRATPAAGAEMTTRQAPLNVRGAPSSLDEKARSVEVVAASETPARVYDYERWEMVTEVLLMSGLERPEQVPLLDSHSRYSTTHVLGSVRDFRVESDQLVATVIFSSTPSADEAFTKVREGHLTDVSVGYLVESYQWVEEGKTAVIEGKTYQGPVKVVTQWRLNELSLVPIGADEIAKTRAAARRKKEERTMPKKLREYLEARGLDPEASEEQAWAYMARLKAAERDEALRLAMPEQERGHHRVGNPAPADDDGGEEPTGDSARDQDPPAPPAQDGGGEPADPEEVRAAERRRIRDIEALCRRFGIPDQDAQRYIDQGTSVEQVRQAVLDLAMERMSRQGAPSVRVEDDERDKFRAAAVDSLLMRGSIEVKQPALGADELRGLSLRGLCREALRISGQRIPAGLYEMVSRAFSSSDLPHILADATNKTLMRAYDTAEETWNTWCSTGEINDFKSLNLLRASEVDALDEIPEGGEYKQAEMTEERETVQLVKYGKVFALTWEMVVNDDLSALTDIPAKFGRAAARKTGDVAYAVLIANAAMGDGVALFHADHSNLLTGADLSIDSLGAAVTAMRTQKDPSGASLNIRPRFFIAPVAMEILAEQLFKSTQEGTQAKPNLVNPFSGSYFTRVYDARLDDADNNAWFLAGPKDMTVKVFFLRGQQRPYLETRQGFEVDGIQYKVRHVCAAKALDWRTLVKNPGPS